MKTLILTLFLSTSFCATLLADEQACLDKRAQFLNESKVSAYVELSRLIVAGGSVCMAQDGANKLNVALHGLVETVPVLGNALLDFSYGTVQSGGGQHAVTVRKKGEYPEQIDFRTYYLNDPKTYDEIFYGDKKEYEDYIIYQNHEAAFANGLLGDLIGGIGVNSVFAGLDYGVAGPLAWLFTGEYKTFLTSDNEPGDRIDVLYSYARARRAKFNYEKENAINSCGKYHKEIKCMADIITKSHELSKNSETDSRKIANKPSNDSKRDFNSQSSGVITN